LWLLLMPLLALPLEKLIYHAWLSLYPMDDQ
jgi:hypothetical protein